MHRYKDILGSVRDRNGVSKSFHRAKVHALAWNSSGSRLASGSADSTAAVYSLSSKLNREFELKGHRSIVEQLSWNPQSEYVLATASSDESVKVWDARAGKLSYSIATEGQNINIAWGPDGNYIAVGNKEDVLSIIDMRKTKVCQHKKFHYEDVCASTLCPVINEFAWKPNGEYLLVTNGNGEIDFLLFPTLKEAMPSIQAHTSNLMCIEFDRSGRADGVFRYFAAGSADSLASLWDAEEYVCVQTYSRNEWPIRSLSFSHDNELLAICSEDAFVDIAYTSTGEMVHQVPTPLGSFSAAWHPKKLVLAIAVDEKDSSQKFALLSTRAIMSMSDTLTWENGTICLFGDF